MQMMLTIDDDVLAAAEARAAVEHRSVGEVISALARQAIHTDPSAPPTRNGITLLTGGRRVTSELVRQLQEELE